MRRVDWRVHSTYYNVVYASFFESVTSRRDLFAVDATNLAPINLKATVDDGMASIDHYKESGG